MKKINDNFICEYNDCGWCYKKDSSYASCVGVNNCHFKKDLEQWLKHKSKGNKENLKSHIE